MQKESIRNKVIQQFRRKAFQPLWQRLYRIAKVGMNYWNQSFYRNGEFWYLKEIKKRYSNSTTIFDVGANIGQYCELISEIFSEETTVHCFEPSSNSCQLLNENINALQSDVVFVPHNFGLSSSNHESTLFGNSQTSDLRSLYNLRYPLKTFKDSIAEKIQLVTLDEFCLANNIDKVHLLKIDVEGHELEVLKGAVGMITSGAILNIQFEYGTCNMDSKVFFRDYYDFLSPFYNIYRLLPNGKWPIIDYASNLEIVDYINYVAELKQ